MRTTPNASRALRAAAVAAALLAVVEPPAAARGQSPAPAAPAVVVTPAEQRRAYLAQAVIWEDRAVPTPDQIVEGPKSPGIRSRADLNPSGGLPCTWQSGASDLGGNTPKFTCRTGDGQLIRVKYFDSHAAFANREVFAEVIASRLFWALGFDADHVYPITIKCLDCPSNPKSGGGSRAIRPYLGLTEAHYDGVPLVSKPSLDQGWTFGELEEAVGLLPDGPDKATRRAQFDALSLLAVFVQHGDRKPEQQRMVCRSDLDASAGDVRPLGGGDTATSGLPALFERAGSRACRAAVVTVQDLGATFGGSGTMRSTKADLGAWSKRRVFRNPSGASQAGACTGDVTALHNAGAGSQANPRIGEAGRALLADRLGRLTDAHIRALFEAARVDAAPGKQEWKDPATGQVYAGLDAWVAVFKDKRSQIAGARCGGS